MAPKFQSNCWVELTRPRISEGMYVCVAVIRMLKEVTESNPMTNEKPIINQIRHEQHRRAERSRR
ncbi:MAG: hypothetical protein MZU97_20315 [Bacillus subtilis]|nr:hypothetical protein [Bacillus subtilis]